MEHVKTFDRCPIETAVCAWEHVSLVRDVIGGYWADRFREDGTAAVRQQVIGMSHKIDVAFDAVCDAWDGYCFDGVFLPDLIDALADPINASEADFIAAAKKLVPQQD